MHRRPLHPEVRTKGVLTEEKKGKIRRGLYASVVAFKTAKTLLSTHIPEVDQTHGNYIKLTWANWDKQIKEGRVTAKEIITMRAVSVTGAALSSLPIGWHKSRYLGFINSIDRKYEKEKIKGTSGKELGKKMALETGYEAVKYIVAGKVGMSALKGFHKVVSKTKFKHNPFVVVPGSILSALGTGALTGMGIDKLRGRVESGFKENRKQGMSLGKSMLLSGLKPTYSHKR